ncbi:hypothetical protein D9M68_709030 [compost metagenome]
MGLVGGHTGVGHVLERAGVTRAQLLGVHPKEVGKIEEAFICGFNLRLVVVENRVVLGLSGYRLPTSFNSPVREGFQSDDSGPEGCGQRQGARLGNGESAQHPTDTGSHTATSPSMAKGC